MKNINTINTEEQEDVWSRLLLVLSNNKYNETLEIWNEFYSLVKARKSVKKHKILLLLKSLKDECTYYLNKNKILYRARAYNNSEIENFFRRQEWENLLSMLKEAFPMIDELNLKYSDVIQFCNYLLCIPDNEKYKSILNLWLEKYSKIKFWGFDKNGSGRNYVAPKAGRLNKKTEHHLYTACDINTAIAEIRPINNQTISVAKIKVLKKLKLFDLTKKFEISSNKYNPDYEMFEYIANICSMPNYNEDIYYKPTQIISQTIKKMKFDGIIYSSALNNRGKNVLIFECDNNACDENLFDIVSSDVYIASNKTIKNKFLPIKQIKFG